MISVLGKMRTASSGTPAFGWYVKSPQAEPNSDLLSVDIPGKLAFNSLSLAINIQEGAKESGVKDILRREWTTQWNFTYQSPGCPLFVWASSLALNLHLKEFSPLFHVLQSFWQSVMLCDNLTANFWKMLSGLMQVKTTPFWKIQRCCEAFAAQKDHGLQGQ